jgi:hypothetical protein
VSNRADDRVGCAPFEDDLATVALGIASGRRREEVLEHVGHCPFCSAELAELSTVADAVLELGPEVEPPVGFELRVTRGLESHRGTRTPRRRRRVLVFTLAAALVVVLGVGLGVFIPGRAGTGPARSASTHPTEASLTSHGRVVGNVVLSTGATPWLIMTIEKDSWSGSVTCEALLAGGRIETIGTFSLSGGYGTWSAPLTSPLREVRGARLVAANGVVLASARLRG